ncbi:MAG: XTP/dITP diphosphatase [Nitrososphaerales archaeon]
MPESNRFIYFATGNKHKFDEAKDILKNYNIKVMMIRKKSEEIQSDDLEEIAKHALLKALESCKSPIIVEDAGLFIKTLKGFPGPYSSYVHRTLGIDGIIDLIKSTNGREAEFRSVVAYGDSLMIKTFEGVVKGMVILRPRGRSGFGFDPIFVPRGSRMTFAEMTLKEKNKYSHRAIALKEFAEWYLGSHL